MLLIESKLLSASVGSMMISSVMRTSSPGVYKVDSMEARPELVLVVPTTNAVSEISASALRRIKMYLRTTMQQARLNSLMILHVHKERTDTLSLNYA